MKFFALGLALLLATVTFGLPSKEFKETYEEFEKEFHVLVDDPKEEEIRAKILEKAEEEINEINNGNFPFKEKLYDFSDLPKDIFMKEKTGLIMPGQKDGLSARSRGLIPPPLSVINDPENAAKLKELYRQLDMDRSELPSSYDAEKEGLVSVVKNQLSCGSCAAFAATGLHETCMIKAGAIKQGLDLSEQYLIDCGYDGNSMAACKGAWPAAYTEWFANNGGMAAHEGKYPYLDKYPNYNCNKAKDLKWNSGAKVTNAVVDYRANEARIKQLLIEHGSVMVFLHTNTTSFTNYASGIYTSYAASDCSGEEKNIDHAVLIVGYGTENGIDYWRVKNSWGQGWGEKGFFRIQRGVNLCKIEQIAVVSKCQSTGERDSVPPTPTPKPIPTQLTCDITGLFTGSPLTGSFRMTVDGEESYVVCEKNICRPANPGPSNACMYICGKLSCKRETTTTNSTTPAITPATTPSTTPSTTSSTTPSTTPATTPSTTQPTSTSTPGTNENCDLSYKYGYNLNGDYRTRKGLIRCTNSICRFIVAKDITLCQYICGKSSCKPEEKKPAKFCDISNWYYGLNINGNYRVNEVEISCINSMCLISNGKTLSNDLCRYFCNKDGTKC